MMITIHGLPVTTKYQDLKILIKQQCNISDFILDSLVNDGDGSKKVRVGLADDSEGSQLMKCLDGFRVAGNVLRLVPVGKSAPPNQPSTFDIRGNYQARNDFPSHGINDPSNIRSMDGRPSPWSSSSQWTPNQPVQLQPQPQNTYNFQQPIATPYGQQVPVKPFEPRDNIPVGHGSQPSQAYGIAPKSNLINLGPQRNMPTNSIRVIPEASLRQPQSDRYPSQQNYNMPQDKPMTIMKDNFQGPSQYNTAAMQDQRSGNFQPQIQPWSSQQKPFEKSHPKGIEKKYIDDRKYPESRRELKSLPEAILKPDMYKRYEDKGNRDMSPHGRPYIRNESPQRHISLTDRPVSHTSRNMSPERMRRVSPTRQVPFPDRDPSGRGVSPSRRALHGDRRYSPTERMPPMDRRISPPGRNIPHEDRRISPSGRHIPRGERRISPPGRNIPRGDRRVSPMERNIPRGDRPISPSGRHIPRGERRISPPGRNVPRGDRRVSPPGRNIPRGDGRISPSGRNIPHVDRRMSPSGRHILHEKRDSPMDRHNMPPERRISPHSRQYSPSGRMIPPERKISPSRKEEYMRGRRVSPKHAPVDRLPGRQSPPRDSARRLSPRTRQESPRRQAPRFSPRRHAEKAMDYQDGHRPIKDVRPAYENPQASKEARYASGYHPSVHEDVQYPLPRQNPWQEREKDFPSKTLNEDRRDMRQQKFEASRSSVPEHVMQVEAKRSKSRASRSPRRDRSPGRDKYRRHSPSPRSPRRSWALEKRRSPEPREPPPPPSWPGQNEYENRSKFPDREKNTIPVWESEERNKKRDDFPSRDAARRDFDEPKRRPETSKWKPVAADDQQPSSSRYMDDDRYRRDPKYPKKDFEAVRSRDFDREEDRKPHPDRRDREFVRDRDDTRYKPELKREDTIRIEEKKKEILMKQEQLQKEIDEVYKRAVDFAKKAEIYKKGEQKKDPGYDQEHRRSDRTYDRYEDDRRSRDDIRMEHPKDADAFKKFKILPAIKAKRQKACDEISEKLMCKYASNISSEYHKRIREEINKTLDKIMMEMFGDKDVSFIEIVVKFNAKHTAKDEQRIFEDVMSSLPSQFRTVKRSAQDDSNIPSKSARHSDELYMSKDQQQLMSNVPQIPGWNLGLLSANMAAHPSMAQMPAQNVMINGPIMVPLPSQYQFPQNYPEVPQPELESARDGHTLYLCKDDFQPIVEYETDLLKQFLIQQLIKVTETSQGWAPDFTLAKHHTAYRHEVLTRDQRSRDWLLSLDFSEFKEFNVLVYNTEELWYERAAVWLPGHSKCRNIDPLTKLKLQNKKLEGVNIGKWKFVKKIVTEKGTRLYVDMPPSSARALEKHKMMLSFELQKVNVFLKAVAVDKDAFDAGLNEKSITNIPHTQNSMMPSLPNNTNIVKIALKGNKTLNLTYTKKVKDRIIYKLFQYHQYEGRSRTDFVKYGICQPGYFGILPENDESRRWLSSLDLGYINRQPVVVVGADDGYTKYIKMFVTLPNISNNTKPALITERLRQSNQGVKGINFNLWKNADIVNDRDYHTLNLEVDMDLESVETISKMNFKLDYVVEGQEYTTLSVESEHSPSKLKDIIDKYKAEMNDTYDVANMELASDSDDDIICLGEVDS